MRTIREDAGIIMEECIRAVLPDEAVLKARGDLIFTGATGTNVNDVMVLLCR
jgi:glycerate-2-kinase